MVEYIQDTDWFKAGTLKADLELREACRKRIDKIILAAFEKAIQMPISPLHIVASRSPGDGHDWTLVRGGRYRCSLCGYTMPVEPVDTLILQSGCPCSKKVGNEQEANT